MFNLLYFKALKMYRDYYYNINNYDHFKKDMLYIDNRENLVHNLFNNIGIYDERYMAFIVISFKVYKLLNYY